jgi:hypothetical protein
MEKIDLQKAKDILTQQILKLQDPNVDIMSWQESSVILLTRIFGDEYQGIKSIQTIKYYMYYRGEDDYTIDNKEECQHQGKEILETCIIEIDNFGLPSREKEPRHGTTINFSQNQSVNIHIQSIFEEVLTHKQIDEISKITHTSESESTKKSRLIEQIKNFGSDVISNILASIIIKTMG